MEWVILLAMFTLGVVAGLVIALVLKHQRMEFKVPSGKEDAWKHLERVVKERAGIKAKQKALKKAYASRKIDESVFVSKDAEYSHVIERLDAEIDALMENLSRSFLEEELKEAGEIMRKASDMEGVAKELLELKKQLKRVENEKESLQVEMRDVEERKKEALAERNELETRVRDLKTELSRKNEELEKLGKELDKKEKEVAEVKSKTPHDLSLANLKRENKMLRESLEEKNRKLARVSKSLGILEIIFERYSDIIEEKETKTPAKLKKLVQPGHHRIIELTKTYKTPEKAFEFVRDDITEIHPEISATYWLTVEEMLELRAADTEDEAILLCSMLRSLGKEARVAVVELDNGKVKSLVLMSDRVLDPGMNARYDQFTGLSCEDALKKYSFEGHFIKKVLYEFNDKEYKKH